VNIPLKTSDKKPPKTSRTGRRSRVVAGLLLVLVAGCAGSRPPASPRQVEDVGSVPLFEGLGTNARRVSTTSREAQRYFDQGLSFLFAFNHDEAVRSFRKAAELDPFCAMTWWGIAYASGPHINNPAMSPEASATAWNALQNALREPRAASAVEVALIDALSARYAAVPPSDRRALDTAYADAMRKVWQRYPDDADVGALFAEAMMDLSPWNQWAPDGQANPGTDEILATLAAVRRIRPDHPLALHLAIHAYEASPHPGRAKDVADRLRDLQPGLGHMVHMPSHIDVRLGQWRQAVTANAKAIAADDRYRAQSPDQGFYGLYIAHNHHMLAYAALMIGREREAVAAIDSLVKGMPDAWKRDFAPIADGYLAMPLEVRLRFGRWDEVLAADEPAPAYPLARALYHYASGVALAAKGDLATARKAREAFVAARARVPREAFFGNNSAADVLAVADRVLDGEIAYREGRRDDAFAALRRGVELEDALRYDEPPAWILPVRHTLGAALLDAKLPREAEPVLRKDLEIHPENGWALYGLVESLKAQGRRSEAARAESALRRAWEGADYAIASPCACLAPGAAH
jgi:tetratricopeptide (TPR) repeat protein